MNIFVHILIFMMLILSCNEAETTKTNHTELAECRLNSDCELGFSCKDAKCIEQSQCITSGCDCENNQACFLANEICDLDAKKCVEKECNEDQDCQLEYICQEGKCFIDTEADRDRDLVPDAIDLCPMIADSMQEDNDLDLKGDACDDDDDNDGILDISDNCRFIKNSMQGDADLDQEGNACDLDTKGTSIVAKLNALEIKLGSYVDSSISLLDHPNTAVIQEDGSFRFEQAVSEEANIVLKINLKGYYETIETAFVNLKAKQYDLGIINLMPKKVDLKGKVEKELNHQHDQIMVINVVNDAQIAQTMSSKFGEFQLSSYQVNQKILLSATGYLTKEIDLIWNERLEDFEFIDENQVTQRFSESVILLKRDLSSSINGEIESTIDDYPYDDIDFKLTELNTQLERHVSVNHTGYFELDNLAQGLYRMEINAAGHLLIREVFQIEAGLNQLGIIELIPQIETEEAYVLQSKVMLLERNQHNGIQVRALINQQSQALDISTLDGTYTLRLNRLDQILSFYKENYVSQQIEIIWDSLAQRFTTIQNGNVVDVSNLIVFLQEDDGPNGDIDVDDVINAIDNCLEIANHDQIDTDMDDIGDECDDDDDGDGLDDITELLISANPLLIDSDRDGIDDFAEWVLLGTALNLVDTDGDEKDDLLEVGNDIRHPLDWDGDGVIDALESILRDSDRDGANDEIDGPSDLGDLDGDGVLNGVDHCVLIKNFEQENLDGDELGDACDEDDDNDRVVDALDNCPRLSNPSQRDTDVDAIGDECDEDDDNDGLVDMIDPYPLLVDFDRDGILDGDGQNAVDNCPGNANLDQNDRDQDGDGDACDDDDDNDGIVDIDDNCPYVENIDQLNSEPIPDSFGDACDLDDDNDGILDVNDNCPLAINVIQSDLDFDGLGNACDDDDDGDGVLDVNDNCPTVRNVDQADINHDGIGNVCAQDIDGDLIIDTLDNCVVIPNVNQRNQDNDRLGDACDDDLDGDSYLNELDNCVFIYNYPQNDLDGDLIGDPCDEDDDNDLVIDQFDSCPRQVNLNQDPDIDNIDSICDNCPLIDNRYQTDLDKDGVGDECDLDDDQDGLNDSIDNCPKISNFDQVDINGDGIGDACEINFEWYMSDEFPITDTAYLNNDLYISTNGGGIIKINQLNVNIDREHYTVGNGLPNNDILRIAVSNHGNLWAQTSEGLSIRYANNGVWETENLGIVNCGNGNINISYSNAVDFDVNKLNGDIYLAYSDKLIKKQGSLLNCYPVNSGILNANINSVDISPDGQQIWIGTAIGASKYTENNGWHSYINADLGFANVAQVGFELVNGQYEAIVMNSVSKNPKSARIIDHNGIDEIIQISSLLPNSFTYTESLLGANSKDVSLTTVFPKITGIPAFDLKLIRKSDDVLYFTARNNTTNILKQFNQGKLIATNPNYLTVNTNNLGTIKKIIFNEDGSYWIASSNGLYRSSNQFIYTTASGLSHNSIQDIEVDHLGVLWIGTDNGLLSFKNGLFSIIPETVDEKILKIILTEDQHILALNSIGHLYDLNGNTISYAQADLANMNLDPEITNFYQQFVFHVKDMIKDEMGHIFAISQKGIWKREEFFTNQSLQFFQNLTYVEKGESIEYLLQNRFAGTKKQILYLMYPNESQRNIQIEGNQIPKPFAIRSSNGTELWLVIKGGFIKVKGWDTPYLDQQVSGNHNLNSVFFSGDPVRLVSMPNQNYAIAKTETTIEQYQVCVDFGICTELLVKAGCNWNVSNKEKHPVNCINWTQSRDFSKWLRGDLPTDEEWIYAATGGRQNIDYPWGNVLPTCQLANYSGCSGKTYNVCSLLNGNTIHGLCDMSGNVSEWILNTYSFTHVDDRVLKGGGWYQTNGFLKILPVTEGVTTSMRKYYDPYDQAGGFRMVKKN